MYVLSLNKLNFETAFSLQNNTSVILQTILVVRFGVTVLRQNGTCHQIYIGVQHVLLRRTTKLQK